MCIEKSLIKTTLKITAIKSRYIRHLDIKLAFTNKLHTTKNVIMKQVRIWDGTYLDPDWCYGRLGLNLYGLNSTAHTYDMGLNQHVITQKYNLSTKNAYSYSETGTHGQIIVAGTMSSISVEFAHKQGALEIKQTMRKIYEMKDPGVPIRYFSYYLGCLNNSSIVISQPAFIMETLKVAWIPEKNNNTISLLYKSDVNKNSEAGFNINLKKRAHILLDQRIFVLRRQLYTGYHVCYIQTG